MSLWQVADAMGVSAEAVRQIEWKALTKLEEEQLLHKLWKRGVVDE